MSSQESTAPETTELEYEPGVDYEPARRRPSGWRTSPSFRADHAGACWRRFLWRCSPCC